MSCARVNNEHHYAINLVHRNHSYCRWTREIFPLRIYYKLGRFHSMMGPLWFSPRREISQDKAIWGSVTAGVIKTTGGALCMEHFAPSCIKMSQEAENCTSSKGFLPMGCRLDSIWQQFTSALHAQKFHLYKSLNLQLSRKNLKREKLSLEPEITPSVSSSSRGGCHNHDTCWLLRDFGSIFIVFMVK